MQKKEILTFDFFRGLSAFLVFLTHGYQIFYLPIYGRNVLLQISSFLGGASVIVFFVLSGFLIFVSVKRNIVNNGFFSLKDYFFSRIYRIYPPLLFSILLVVGIEFIMRLFSIHGSVSFHLNSDQFDTIRTNFSYSGSEVLGTLFQSYAFLAGNYLSINGPLWSLSYEVGFYLLTGMFFFVTKGSIRKTKLIKSVLFLFLILLLSVIYLRKPYFYGYLLIWLLGAFYFVFRETVRTRFRLPIYPFVLLALVSLMFFLYNLDSEFMRFELTKKAMFGAFVFSIFIVVLIDYIIKLDCLENGIFTKVSEFSYTLYLSHFPLLLFLFGFFHEFAYLNRVLYHVLFFIALVISFFLSKFAARFVESLRFVSRKS